MTHVLIVRNVPGVLCIRQVIYRDFVRYVKGDPTQNIELRPGDFIYVPRFKQLSAMAFAEWISVQATLDFFRKHPTLYVLGLFH